jgi:hypothetical protein
MVPRKEHLDSTQTIGDMRNILRHILPHSSVALDGCTFKMISRYRCAACVLTGCNACESRDITHTNPTHRKRACTVILRWMLPRSITMALGQGYFKHIRKHSKTFKNMQKHAKTFKNMQKHSKTFKKTTNTVISLPFL